MEASSHPGVLREGGWPTGYGLSICGRCLEADAARIRRNFPPLSRHQLQAGRMITQCRPCPSRQADWQGPSQPWAGASRRKPGPPPLQPAPPADPSVSPPRGKQEQHRACPLGRRARLPACSTMWHNAGRGLIPPLRMGAGAGRRFPLRQSNLSRKPPPPARSGTRRRRRRAQPGRGDGQAWHAPRRRTQST